MAASLARFPWRPKKLLERCEDRDMASVRRLGWGLIGGVVVALTGCCSWCERHCGHSAPVAYAQPYGGCCQPACCPPPCCPAGYPPAYGGGYPPAYGGGY